MKAYLLLIATISMTGIVFTESHSKDLPALHPQPNAEMTTFEHIQALNDCDWDRLMSQYPEEVLIILPNGAWVEGRAAVGDVFDGFASPVRMAALKAPPSSLKR